MDRLRRGRVFTPRRILTATIALWVIHIGVLVGWGGQGQGPLLSLIVQLVLAVLCTLALLDAPPGAGDFERRFLRLIALRYAICIVGQVLGAYEEADPLPFQGSLADVVFHLEDVPLGIALLLDAGPDNDHPEPARLRDLAQMLVFCVAIFSYFRAMPTPSDVGLGLTAGADVVVAAAFYCRALLTKSNLARALFGRWTPAILLSTVNAAYSGYPGSPRAGDLFDVVWVMETVVWILTAVTWTWPRDKDGSGAALPPIDRTVHLLPLVVFCFVVVLAVGIAQENRGLGAALAIASIACLQPARLGLLSAGSGGRGS